MQRPARRWGVKMHASDKEGCDGQRCEESDDDAENVLGRRWPLKAMNPLTHHHTGIHRRISPGSPQRNQGARIPGPWHFIS